MQPQNTLDLLIILACLELTLTNCNEISLNTFVQIELMREMMCFHCVTINCEEQNVDNKYCFTPS